MIFEPTGSERKKSDFRREIVCISELEKIIEESFFDNIDIEFDEIVIEPAGIQIQTHKRIYVISVKPKNKMHKTVVGTLVE